MAPKAYREEWRRRRRRRRRSSRRKRRRRKQKMREVEEGCNNEGEKLEVRK